MVKRGEWKVMVKRGGWKVMVKRGGWKRNSKRGVLLMTVFLITIEIDQQPFQCM